MHVKGPHVTKCGRCAKWFRLVNRVWFALGYSGVNSKNFRRYAIASANKLRTKKLGWCHFFCGLGMIWDSGLQFFKIDCISSASFQILLLFPRFYGCGKCLTNMISTYVHCGYAHSNQSLSINRLSERFRFHRIESRPKQRLHSSTFCVLQNH